MVNPAAQRSDDTVPDTGSPDLATLQSDLVAASSPDPYELWPTTRRGRVLYALAAVAAIILGVIPALWINRWRVDAASSQPPRVEAKQAEVPAAEEPALEPIEIDPIEPAAADIEEARPRPPSNASTVRPAKRARSKPEPKQPARARKRATPPCDIYLHPRGCPR